MIVVDDEPEPCVLLTIVSQARGAEVRACVSAALAEIDQLSCIWRQNQLTRPGDRVMANHRRSDRGEARSCLHEHSARLRASCRPGM
jgi:hypothetical protein